MFQWMQKSDEQIWYLVGKQQIPSAAPPLHTLGDDSFQLQPNRFHTFSILQIDKCKSNQIHFILVYHNLYSIQMFHRIEKGSSSHPTRCPCPRLRMENPSSFGSEVYKRVAPFFLEEVAIVPIKPE